MGRFVGTVSRGLISPIIKQGDDIAEIAVKTLLSASEGEGFTINDRDILAVTESIVARAQGNYATLDQISEDIKNKFSGDKIGVVFPILSRNRFALCLEGFAKTGNEIILMLSYPSDEVGNHIVDPESFENSDVNPWTHTFSPAEFRVKFGEHKHKFTGIDYIEYYDSILKKYNKSSSIILSNDIKTILDYTKSILVCDIHTRNKTKKLLKKYGAEKIVGIDEVLSSSVNGSGFNPEYGLLGSNKATDSSVKLFPRDCTSLVKRIQKLVYEKTGKKIEVLVYGDGAFKDPVGKIWELADPVVAPGFTEGLNGKPCEVKLKYLADNNFKNMDSEAQKKAITEYIAERQKQNVSGVGEMVSEGTTPRRLTDLIGSLCDLTSGSGDKGTPIIFIQGYFDKYQG